MTAATHDVFLSYSQADAGSALAVERAMSAAGLTVCRASEVSTGSPLSDAMLEALVECSALVAIITPLGVRSANIVVELGMAMSWQKPVYLLLDGVKPDELFAGAR